MDNSSERSRGEIILFIVAIFGIWLSIWAVILVSNWLEVVAVGLTLCALIGFALRDTD
jgi:nitrate reductase NapE component